MALALLAADWARSRGGGTLALIVDHGLRPASAAEAALTQQRLAAHGIPARVLTLHGLHPGPSLAVRARAARLDALIAAATEAGALHLLLGHHAADQAETVLMRARAGSGAAGLAGIPALRETHALRLLRPLLHMPPAELRAFLRDRGVGWIEDPSNQDPRTTRARLRAELGGELAGLPDQAACAGAARAVQDAAIARDLAARATISPLGYALLSPGPLSAPALAALWQAISGRAYPPPSNAIARIAAAPAPATLAGVRLLDAGRLGPGLLLVRDGPPVAVPACHQARWDRFRLHAPGLPPGLTIAALGAAAAKFRHASPLPSAVLRTLPALWRDTAVVAVPGLRWSAAPGFAAAFHFQPARPAAGAPWHVAAPQEVCTARDA
jgi:tRNA(Ile)-lysidine synthase